MAIDITELTFEEWVEFIFNHPVTKPAWHWSDEWEYYASDGVKLVRYLIRLFREPSFLFERYSREQLEQAFWFVPTLLCFVSFRGLLWQKNLPWKLRRELIVSIGDLFERFFAVDALETSCFMWWDVLAYGYHMTGGKPEDKNGARVQQAMFETLKRILYLDSRDCRMSALHGLGHLKHPELEKTIDEFLAAHTDLDEELKKYALQCRMGEIM
ncbi:MAG TPA: hypothetical protein VF666_08230 [Pyrinomonadaceae bacterium]|jgi:hypothetical protein